MSAQSRTTLKTYFNTGDKPTEAQFENLIDSGLNLTDGGTVVGASHFSGSSAIVTITEPVRKTKFDLGAQVSLDPQHDGTDFSSAQNEVNQWRFRCGNTLAVHAIGGAQTLKAPLAATNGLDVSGDQTNGDGWSFRGRSNLFAGVLNKDHFIIGTSPAFYVRCKFSIADVSGFSDIRLGFAKVEAHNATVEDLDEIAAFAVISGDIKTITTLNNASEVTTDLTAPSSGDWADGETHTLQVNVSAAGVVTYLLDDTVPTGAVAYTFDNAEVVTPFWFHTHSSELGGALVWQEFEFGLQ